jgi:hypothetical protein
VGWLEQMHAELVAEVGSPEDFAELGGGWITGCMDEVFPVLAQRLRDDPVSRASIVAQDDVNGIRQAGPGQVLGELFTYRKHPAVTPGRVLYSQRSWGRFLDGLSGVPFGVQVSMLPMDSAGFPAYRDSTVRYGRCIIRVHWDRRSPGWARFRFSARAGKPPDWPESADTQQSWAGFVRRQAARLPACAGSMTDDKDPGLDTALQHTTPSGNLLLRIDQSREALQGYSWVTVVAPQVAVRLGGADAMSRSGAFCEVEELPNKALWLRATPRINDFTGDRVRKVFEALAPVMITGTTKFRGHEMYRLAEGVDAADYR